MCSFCQRGKWDETGQCLFEHFKVSDVNSTILFFQRTNAKWTYHLEVRRIKGPEKKKKIKFKTDYIVWRDQNGGIKPIRLITAAAQFISGKQKVKIQWGSTEQNQSKILQRPQQRAGQKQIMLGICWGIPHFLLFCYDPDLTPDYKVWRNRALTLPH